MNCQETRALLSEYHDHELSREIFAAMKRHLAGCAACSEEYRKLKKGVDILRKLKSLNVPRDYSKRLS